MCSSDKFAPLKRIGQLIENAVEMKKNIVYSLVILSLILPVAIATVKRTFSTMNIVKNRLRNRIRDQWVNDHLVMYMRMIYSRLSVIKKSCNDFKYEDSLRIL